VPSSTQAVSAPVTPIELERFLPYRLSVLTNTVSRSLARVYQSQFGLSIPEWRVLAVLARFAPLSAGDVAARAAMDKVQVSRAVSRLLKRNLLIRATDGSDRRRSQLQLADHGWQIYAEIVPQMQRYQQDLEGALTDEEAVALDKLLTKLQCHADGAA